MKSVCAAVSASSIVLLLIILVDHGCHGHHLRLRDTSGYVLRKVDDDFANIHAKFQMLMTAAAAAAISEWCELKFDGIVERTFALKTNESRKPY